MPTHIALIVIAVVTAVVTTVVTTIVAAVVGTIVPTTAPTPKAAKLPAAELTGTDGATAIDAQVRRGDLAEGRKEGKENNRKLHDVKYAK